MKKILNVSLLMIFITVLAACSSTNTQSETTTEYITGMVTLPVALSIDSSDGVMKIPFETEGDEEAIIWSSSDTNIASIDEQGYVTVLAEGQVTLTAVSGSHTATTKLIATFDKYTDYIRINTKTEFLATFSNPANYSNPNNRYVLATDIDFGGDNIEPIGGWDLSNDETPMDPNTQFRATLDGRGYALKNFNISNPRSTKVGTDYFGVSLFPFIYDGTVRNLNIIDASFSGTGFTGSIAGKILYGTIENCFVRATITATSDNSGIPAGGIAGIIGPDAIVKNVILDVKVNGGYIYSGFNFGTGSNCNAISETLDDSELRRPLRNTAISTMKGNEDEDAALNDFLNSVRIENEQLSDFNSYTLTEEAKQNYWFIVNGYMPFLIRFDGIIPDWAEIKENI